MKKYLLYIGLLILVVLTFVLLCNQKETFNDCVVYIESKDEETIKSGSGFVYKVENNKNYIVTNYHVIEGYSDIYIYNKSKKRIKAEILNYDEYTDIAILIIDNKLNLKQIDIGNSDDIELNDNVRAIGTNDNLENINEISKGNVISLNKNITLETNHGNSYLEAIELSIDVSYGNSGGPLLNENNKVIGMMIAKEKDKNIAYALPINYVMDMVTKLENQELYRPNLGAVMCNSTNTELLNEYGIQIKSVSGVVILNLNEKGLLYKKGLQIGDVITKFENDYIYDVNSLRSKLYQKQVGDMVEIEYYRDGIYYKLNMSL